MTAYDARSSSGSKHAHSYVDWGSIFSGAIVAAAISTIMTTFGAAVGLSTTSAYSGQGISLKASTIAAILWVLWVAVSSFAAGGYLSGRLRRRIDDATDHEVEIRDGAHGLVMWAIGAVLITYLATSSVTGITKSVANVAGPGVSGIAAAAGQSAVGPNPFEDGASLLLRTSNSGAAGDPKADVAHILQTSVAAGSINPEDKAYLSNLIASRAGISPDDASKRVDQAVASAKEAAQKARDAAEAARKIGVLIAFLTAATLAICAATAWWSAVKGGEDRDSGIDLSHLTKRRQTTLERV
jgi:hypothetical protein